MRTFHIIFFAFVIVTLVVTAVYCQDSLNVSKVAEVVFWDYLVEITHSGNYVHASAGEGGMHVFDVSNPENPVEIGCCNTPGYVEEIVVVDTIAYIADDEEGVRIIDVSDPCNPHEVGCYNTSGHAHGLEVRNNYVYLADGWQGFRIIDVSNPRNPIETSHLPIGGSDPGTNKIALYGNYAYVTYSECECGFGGKMFIIDINDPYDPLIVDSLITHQYIESAEVFDHYLCTASTGNFWGIYIYDISNPYNVTQVNHLSNFFESRDIYLVGDTLYITECLNGISVMNVSNPSDPVLIGSYNAGSLYPIGISVTDGLAFVGSGQQGLIVLDVSNPASIQWVANICRAGSFREISISNGYAFVANSEMGLCVFDISPPENTCFVTNVSLSEQPHNLVIMDEYCYISCDDNQFDDRGIFYIVDISNPQELTVVSEMILTHGPRGVDVTIDYAYIAVLWDGLLVVDVSDVYNPSVVQCIPLPSRTDEVDVWEDHAFLAIYDYGMVIMSIFDPANPSILSVFDSDDVDDVSVFGDMAYYMDYVLGVYAVNISNLYYPGLMGHLDPPGSFFDIKAIGDYVFLAGGHEGLRVIDVRNPCLMEETGFYTLEEQAYQVAVSGSYAYVAASSIFAVLDHSAATGVENQQFPEIPTTFALSHPYPNPFNPTTVLTYHLPNAGMVELQVYDILGRKVTEIVNSWHNAGTYRTIFDATTHPSGVYFARLTTGDFQQTQKMLLLK
jgi:hypothetical protein